MRPRTPLLLGAALILASAMTGCSKSPSLPGAPGPNAATEPDFVTVSLTATGTADSRTEEKEIEGENGESIDYGRFRLIVPPGAWQGRATVTMRIPDENVLRCELEISPGSANSFATPVILEIDFANTQVVDATTLHAVWLDETAGVWREVPGSSVNSSQQVVRAPLSHFSQYGVAQGKGGW